MGGSSASTQRERQAGARHEWQRRARYRARPPVGLLADALVAAARAHGRGNRAAAPSCAAELGRGHFAGQPQLVGVAAGEALTAVVGDLWRAGWLPADLWEITRRRADGLATSLLVDAIADDVARHEPDSIHERWLGQLRQLGAEVWWDAESAHLPQWAERNSLSIERAVLTTIVLLATLVALPGLPRILSPPGVATHRAPGRGTDVDQKVLARVRGLLAKAESTQFPQEAEALSAKAQELMNRHAFDRALLDADTDVRQQAASARLWLDSPYVDAKSHLVAAIAKANRCRSVFYPGLGFVALVGDELDLGITELLATSLLVQATRAMVAESSYRGGAGASRTRSFRRSFLLSYATRIGERLAEASTRARDPARDERLLPVLAERSRVVDETFEALYSHTVRKTVSVSNGEGWQAGRAAADRADLTVRRRLPDP